MLAVCFLEFSFNVSSISRCFSSLSRTCIKCAKDFKEHVLQIHIKSLIEQMTKTTRQCNKTPHRNDSFIEPLRFYVCPAFDERNVSLGFSLSLLSFKEILDIGIAL